MEYYNLINQFITFAYIEESQELDAPMTHYAPGGRLDFICMEDDRDYYFVVDGIKNAAFIRTHEYLGHIELSTEDAEVIGLKDGMCFYLETEADAHGRVFRSNNIKYYEKKDGLAFIQYWCDEDAFGFPWGLLGGDTYAVTAYVPMRLHSPQFNQADEIYTTLSGKNIVLYSELNKEYEVEVDYLTDELHRKLLVALSCDYLYVDGELLTKSDKYDIDWGNADTLGSGEKIAKAKFKLKSNIVNRNSN